MTRARDKLKGFLARPGVLYSLLGIAAGVILVAALASLSSLIINGWINRDMDLRAELIYRSIRDQAAASGAGEKNVLSKAMEQISEDERILGLGFCTGNGKLAIATSEIPANLDCAQLAHRTAEGATFITPKGEHIRISFFPLNVGETSGKLLIVHDLDVVNQRERDARLYVMATMAAVAAGFAILVIVLALGLR